MNKFIDKLIKFIKELIDKVKKDDKPQPPPSQPTDPDKETILKWTTPSTFHWPNRAPKPNRIIEAPTTINLNLISKNKLVYSIENFNGLTYEKDTNVRLENYTFKKNGELYMWKDWGPNASGEVDGRWIKVDKCEHEGWEDTGVRDGMNLDDFDSIVVHLNIATGEVYAKSKVFNKKDVK